VGTTKRKFRAQALENLPASLILAITLSRRYRDVMTLRPVDVECYSGSRADERPRIIRTGGREYVVMKLLGESVEESFVGKSRRRRYKVLTREGLALNLIRAEDGDWFLEEEPPV